MGEKKIEKKFIVKSYFSVR